MGSEDPDTAPVADRLLPGSQVPVIDLGVEEAELIRQIGEACRRWGFFQVVGHPVAMASIEQALRQTRAFFALPKEAKRSLSRSRDNPWGYYDRELTKNRRDKKEIFDIGPDLSGSATDEPFAGRTPWPAAPPEFAPTMRAYFAACEQIAERLMDLISRSLGASPGDMARAFQPAHTSFLRLNYYPVADPLEGEAAGDADLGIHHHTDAGAVTVLLQDGISGLQVYRDGAWYLVQPLEGAFVINIGDMVQVWSNDLYRAPLHRVLAMDKSDRYSLPFFYNPSYDTVVAPLPSGADEPHYRGIAWGEYRRRRADGDFADYGAEVQISDYRR